MKRSVDVTAAADKLLWLMYIMIIALDVLGTYCRINLVDWPWCHGQSMQKTFFFLLYVPISCRKQDSSRLYTHELTRGLVKLFHSCADVHMQGRTTRLAGRLLASV